MKIEKVTTVEAWEALSSEEQYSAILSACRAALRMRPQDAARARVTAAELAGDAWIRADKRIKDGANSLIYNILTFSALDALRAAARFNWHSVGGTVEENDDETITGEQTDKSAGFMELGETDYIHRPTEDQAAIRCALEQATENELQEKILSAVLAGVTRAELQKVEKISAGKIDRELKKIREKLKNELI